jgi:hypothetical protein
MDTYWNGVKSNFGEYVEWPQFHYFGYVDRKRTIHEDSETGYVELTLISIAHLMNYGFSDEMFWATSGSDEEITVAALKVLDIPWGILQKYSNAFHNVIIYDDTTAITNLKIAKGPAWDVLKDVCERTFSTMYCTRMGDIYIVPDPDIRWDDYEPGGITAMFTFDTGLFSSIDLISEDVDDAGADPRSPDDPTVGQVVFRAIQPDLSEIWARFPADVIYTIGRRVEVGGLVCESEATLRDWAERYYYKLQRAQEADLRLFMLHVLDLYTWVGLTFSPNTDRVTNSGISSPVESDYYVTSVDLNLDPGMGTLTGSTHIRVQSRQDDTDAGDTGSG